MSELTADAALHIANMRIDALEAIVVELLVELEARKRLSRADVARTMLRAECAMMQSDVAAELDEGGERETDGAVRLTSDVVEHRLGAAPEFYLARTAQHRWMMEGQSGPSPLEPRQSARRARRGGRR